MTHEMNISLQLQVPGAPRLRHNSGVPLVSRAFRSSSQTGVYSSEIEMTAFMSFHCSFAVGLRTVLTVILQDPT